MATCAAILALAGLAMLSLWRRPSSSEVVCYVTHDQPFSQPVLERFERETGIVVRAVYDTEASKTVGLFNRLLAEEKRPLCDVFWNNEPARMVQLSRRGLLAAWSPPGQEPVPQLFRDRLGRWYGFAARVRVLIYNTRLVRETDAPRSVFDLTSPRWKGRAAIANPLFGSTSTHTTALPAKLGDERLRTFLEGLRGNEAQVVDGNSGVRIAVAAGTASIGVTDTDDALEAVRSGESVAMVVPDQGQGEMGALVLPNTVGILAGAPHPVQAGRLAEFLVSPGVERELAASAAGQIPLRPGLAQPAWLAEGKPIRPMEVSLEAIADGLPSATKLVQKVLLR